MIFESLRWNGVPNFRRNRYVKFRGQKTERFQDWHGLCVCEWFHIESFWVLANEAGSQRPGTQILDATWTVWIPHDPPKKSMHPPFSDKCHPTIFSSPRSFAVFSFLRPPFFRLFHHLSAFSQLFVVPRSTVAPPTGVWFFHIFPAFSQLFPAVFRGSPAPSPFSKLRRRDDERHNVGRGKGLGKDAGAAARQAGEVRLIRLAAQVGAPWGWWWLWPGWRGIFIQFYLGFESILIGDENTISEFGGSLVLNYFDDVGENGDIWIDFMRFWPLVFAFWAVLIKGVDTEIYLIVLENGYLRMGQTTMVNGEGRFTISMWTAEYSVSEPVLTCWFSWYFTFNLFRAKADERQPQYWWLLLNKGCWNVHPQYFCSSLMIQPWKNWERAIVTSRPEEGVGTKPWKELSEIIYGIVTPKRSKFVNLT